MRVACFVMLLACSAPANRPAPAPAPSAEAQRDLAVAEPVAKQPEKPAEPFDPTAPVWIQHRDEQRPNVNDVIVRRRLEPEPERHVAESDLWSPCVRDFVHRHPEDLRRALTAAFSRYVVSCDAQRNVVVAPRHEVRGKAFVAFAGTLAHGRQEMMLHLATCGAPRTIEQVTIVYDGKRWTGAPHATERRDGCTIAVVIDQRSLRRVLRDVLEARDATVVLDSAEVWITDEMKRDIRLMLDALDALAT